MIEFDIPGRGNIDIKDVLLDYNGTLAVDGELLGGVKERMAALSDRVNFHVITADTFGSVRAALAGAACEVVTLPGTGTPEAGGRNQAQAKADYLESLGPATTLACGNGANDRIMLERAVLGVGVLLDEGMAVSALTAADILIKDILDLFGLLENPGRLVACLRV